MRGLALGLAVLAGCANSNDNSSAMADVTVSISTAALIARSAALGFDAVLGTPAACVTVTRACAQTFPCQGEAMITFGPSCPLALGGEVSGTARVTGSWTSSMDAVVDAEFTGVKQVGSSQAAVATAKGIIVNWQTDVRDLQYSAHQAVPRAGVSTDALGAGSSWQVSLDTRGTPAFTDDVLTISSASDGSSDPSSKALDFQGVQVSPDCALNPTVGTGTFTRLAGVIPTPTVTTFDFHPACDGKLSVDGASQAFVLFPR